MSLDHLQSALGYTFGDPSILLQSLTHTSFGHEFLSDRPLSLRNNERLEFLGDSVLDLVISDLLLETFPEASEGQLSKLRAAVVNEKTLADIARSIRLGDCLRLGRGEVLTAGREKPSILSSGLEALIAAVYLDGGFPAAYQVLRPLFEPIFSGGATGGVFEDHKTQLQEVVQARYRITPTYTVLQTSGPDHAKIFEVEVSVRDQVLARATGTSKKEAEQGAARAAIQAL